MNEIYNLLNNIDGQTTDLSHCKFIFTTDQPELVVSRIREIALIIAKENSDSWSQDLDYWEKKLPKWFYQKISSNTISMVLDNDILWDYQSWINALKYRAWEWFSSKITSNEGEVTLLIHDIP